MSEHDLTDFFEEPALSPRKIMSLLERFLPFGVEAYLAPKDADLLKKYGYETGLIDSNFAMIVATIATSPDYSEKPFPRERLFALVRQALETIAALPWEKLQPLAWTYVATALVLVKDRTDPALFQTLRANVARWADRLLSYDFPSGLYRDTKAEETCWTVGALVGAQVLHPGDPRCAAWQEKAHRFYLNSYNREEDLWEETVLEGLPVRERVKTANVFPDFTTENHGAFHPVYQACFNNYAGPYLLYKKFLGRVPETLVWNWKELHGVMARLYTKDGKILYPAGNDYYPYSHGEQAHYLAIVTDALKDPLGLWALKKAMGNLERFQRANGGRFVSKAMNGDHHVYWEYHFASFVTFAYALAPYEGIEAYDDEQALAHAGGPWVSPYTGLLVHKGKKLHAGFAFRTLTDAQAGSGFVVPQDASVWTDYFCALPHLAPSIRNAAGETVKLELTEKLVGSTPEEAWALGAWADPQLRPGQAGLRIRRTSAFLTGDEEALHVERIMRYGEQVPIFGSDWGNERVKAEKPEYGPWSVETLNYRIVNDALFFRPLRIVTAEGEKTVRDEACSWTSDGDWVLLDGRLGLVRLWGEGAWHLDYRHETKPLRETHYWKHDTWALNLTFRRAGPPPRGYGLMAGHAVLFVPETDPKALAAIATGGGARIEEHHGDFVYTSTRGKRTTTHLLRLGHLLAFA